MKELKIMEHLISKAFFILSFFIPSLFTSCSISKKIGRQADALLLNDTAIRTGHIGISIYEPATNTYWYNYNADNYFIPASNTKLFTLYAGMKYLGDSLVNGRLFEDSNTTYFLPAGDPTFLHKDFKFQPIITYLHRSNHNIVICDNSNDVIEKYGKGWAWDDYQSDYMIEKNRFPTYGNVFTIKMENGHIKSIPPNIVKFPYFDEPGIQLSSAQLGGNNGKFSISRFRDRNKFRFYGAKANFTVQQIPFITGPSFDLQINFLIDTLKKTKDAITQLMSIDFPYNIIHSQPSDSLFKPMMHRSDNFFAEQTLLMASNEYLGYMSDEKIIDTILKTTLKDVPQKPKWVDGSGLSRYNLFTPRSFVYILNKTRNEFGWERVKEILPTGGEGTMVSYFKKDSSFIYGKTGTLSNNCALSGYLITKKGKLLIFSILTNNYITGATPVRKATEKFLLAIREKY